MHVYCTLLVVAHSTGTICVALYAVICNVLTLQCKCIAADHGGVDENGIVDFCQVKIKVMIMDKHVANVDLVWHARPNFSLSLIKFKVGLAGLGWFW